MGGGGDANSKLSSMELAATGMLSRSRKPLISPASSGVRRVRRDCAEDIARHRTNLMLPAGRTVGSAD